MKRSSFAVALAVAGVGVSLSSARGARSAEVAPPPAPQVTVAEPVLRPVERIHHYPGHVEAVERVEVMPRVTGHLESLHFAEGQVVARGALLARIDPRPYRVALAEAEAALARARAEAETAAAEAERAQRLLARQATSAEDAERRAAQAAVARAHVAAAEAAVERARLDLGYTELRSPIAGRMGRALLTAGNLVDSDSRLAVVVSLDPVYVRFDVEESLLGGGDPGAWAVRFAPEGGEPASGRIAFLDNEVGAGTGTIRVRARLANSGGALRPGMYGSVLLSLGRPAPALLVDERAIGTDQGQRYVLTVGENNELAYRPVRTGARHGALRVIEDGLAAGDRVVTSGLARVRPGMTVDATAVPMDPAQGE